MRQEPRKNHLISKVILQQFTDADSRLTSFDLQFSHPSSCHPAQVGWRKNYVARNQVELEHLWGATEERAQAAIAAVRNGTALDDPTAVETLKNLIALHFMRSARIKAIWDVGFEASLATARAPAHFTGQPGVFEAVVKARVRAQHDAMFAVHQRENFVKAKASLSTAGLEVIETGDAPVLISDQGTLSLSTDGAGRPRFGHVPFLFASSHVLAIGPRHLVALGREDRIIAATPERTAFLNAQQVRNAERHVFYAPADAQLGQLARESWAAHG